MLIENKTQMPFLYIRVRTLVQIKSRNTTNHRDDSSVNIISRFIMESLLILTYLYIVTSILTGAIPKPNTESSYWQEYIVLILSDGVDATLGRNMDVLPRLTEINGMIWFIVSNDACLQQAFNIICVSSDSPKNR